MITGSFIVARDEDAGVDDPDDYYYDEWAARTEHALFEQVGDQAGGTLLLAARQVQIVDVGPSEYGPAIRGQEVTWRGRTFQSGTDAISKSALALHFF